MSAVLEAYDKHTRPLGLVAAVLIPGAVLSLLSATIVGIVVPELAEAFPADAGEVHWAATAALLAAGAAIPVSGWATLRFGIRKTWLAGLAVFTLGSVGVAFASTLPVLVAFRAVQGVGTGIVEPVMLTALARAAGPDRMGRVMGIAGASMAVGPLAGPLLGGALVDSVGWRWIFIVIAALGALVLAASVLALPKDEHSTAVLDLPGLLLLAGGSVSLLAAVSRAGEIAGIDSTVRVLLAVGVAAAVTFAWWLQRRGQAAIIDRTTFRAPGFTPGVLVMMLSGAAVYPLLFGLPQFYREAVGIGPFAAAMLIGAYGVGTLAAMLISGRLSDTLGARPPVVAGALLTSLGATAFVLAGTDAPTFWFAVLSFVMGFGVGGVNGPAVGAAYRSLDARKIPSGSTILFIANQIGGALGVAIFATTLNLASPSGQWGTEVGTLPLLLPAAASLAIALVALRLDQQRRELR